ncbi:MAG: hypothetical protein WAK48_08040 [Candidatus Acidiferrum sp.]
MLWLDKLTNVLVLVLLVEMMVAAGLGVSLDGLVNVLRNAPLLISAGLANYVVVPAIFISLLYAFQANPMDFADDPVAALDNRSLGPCETSSARGKLKETSESDQCGS